MFLNKSVYLSCYEHQFMLLKLFQLKTQPILSKYSINYYFSGQLEEVIYHDQYLEVIYLGSFKDINNVVNKNIESENKNSLYYYDSYNNQLELTSSKEFVIDPLTVLQYKTTRTRVPPRDLICYVKQSKNSVHNTKVFQYSGIHYSNQKGYGTMYLDCQNWTLQDIEKKKYYLSRCLQAELLIILNIKLNPSYKIIYQGMKMDIYYIEHNMQDKLTKLICKYSDFHYKYNSNSEISCV